MAGHSRDALSLPRPAFPVRHPAPRENETLVRPGETIEQAARRHAGVTVHLRECEASSTIESFAKGAYYAPVTWWIAHLNTLAYHGALGRRLKINAQINHSLLAQILWAVSTEPKARAAALKVFGYLMRNNSAALAGRVSGATFINYAGTGGGRLSTRPPLPRKIRIAAIPMHLILATYGAGILGIIKGLKSVEKMMAMLATGNFEFVICLPRLDDLDIDLEDFEHDRTFKNLVGMLNVTHQYVMHGEEIFR